MRWLFIPRDDMGHVGCDADDTDFFSLVVWALAILGLMRLLRCMKLFPVSHL